jgi:hypothetical protein
MWMSLHTAIDYLQGFEQPTIPGSVESCPGRSLKGISTRSIFRGINRLTVALGSLVHVFRTSRSAGSRRQYSPRKG